MSRPHTKMADAAAHVHTAAEIAEAQAVLQVERDVRWARKRKDQESLVVEEARHLVAAFNSRTSLKGAPTATVPVFLFFNKPELSDHPLMASTVDAAFAASGWRAVVQAGSSCAKAVVFPAEVGAAQAHTFARAPVDRQLMVEQYLCHACRRII